MQKNKLNLYIYGIHLLNPYKTVVSHLKLSIYGGERWVEIWQVECKSLLIGLASFKLYV